MSWLRGDSGKGKPLCTNGNSVFSEEHRKLFSTVRKESHGEVVEGA